MAGSDLLTLTSKTRSWVNILYVATALPPLSVRPPLPPPPQRTHTFPSPLRPLRLPSCPSVPMRGNTFKYNGKPSVEQIVSSIPAQFEAPVLIFTAVERILSPRGEPLCRKGDNAEMYTQPHLVTEGSTQIKHCSGPYLVATRSTHTYTTRG